VQNKLRHDAIEPIALVPMIASTTVTVAASAWVDVNRMAQQNQPGLSLSRGRDQPSENAAP
jgi:hypothetical protein